MPLKLKATPTAVKLVPKVIPMVVMAVGILAVTAIPQKYLKRTV
jgi:hypothetical protein